MEVRILSSPLRLGRLCRPRSVQALLVSRPRRSVVSEVARSKGERVEPLQFSGVVVQRPRRFHKPEKAGAIPPPATNLHARLVQPQNLWPTPRRRGCDSFTGHHFDSVPCFARHVAQCKRAPVAQLGRRSRLRTGILWVRIPPGAPKSTTGYGVMVTRLVRDQEHPGSSPGSPTSLRSPGRSDGKGGGCHAEADPKTGEGGPSSGELRLGKPNFRAVSSTAESARLIRGGRRLDPCTAHQASFRIMDSASWR